eukprot:TRINITY_DN3357_c0_g1_i9.p1 TRINITY_DN3357_c0_g1~~TRINITY_DN3357_c0_g1_i9.p1  ORF type:complete len:1103 (+),score=200.69 TRINITY_DN3357_c0_g1_i9:230-3538(+)
MKCALIIIVIVSVLIHTTLGRPSFETREDIAGSIHPDSDGLYRHSSSNFRTRSENIVNRHTTFDYSAKLKPPIETLHRLDIDLNVEDVTCEFFGDEVTLKILVNDSKNDAILGEWKIGHTVVGGIEWGCVNAKQHVVPISMKISSTPIFESNLLLVSGEVIPFNQIFEELHLSLSFPDSQKTSSPVDSVTYLESTGVFEKQTAEPLLLVEKKKDSQTKKSTVSVRSSDPVIYTPSQNDVFITGEQITTNWANLDGSTVDVYLYIADNLLPDTKVFEFDDVPNTGSYTFPTISPQQYSASQFYYVKIEYSCDLIFICDDVESQYFSVNQSPDVKFYTPIPSQMFFLNDVINVNFTISEQVSGDLQISIWRQNPFLFDSQIASSSPININSLNFVTQSFQVTSSFDSSNSYYVLVEYNCLLDGFGVEFFCDSQSSDLFTVVQSSEPPHSAEFLLPSFGSYFLSSSQSQNTIPVSILGNFNNNQNIQFTLYKQRVGWDSDVTDFQKVFVATSKNRFDFVINVDASWEPGNYYLYAEWDCTTNILGIEFCLGVESERFLLNTVPQITFSSSAFPTLVEVGQTISVTWSTTLSPTSIDVYLRTDIPLLIDPQSKILSVQSNQGGFTWVANTAGLNSLLWSFYFELRFNCEFYVLCDIIVSPLFRIDNAGTTGWNINSQKQIINPQQTLFDVDCNVTTAQCNSGLLNKNSLPCLVCSVPGFNVQSSTFCNNCFSELDWGVSKLELDFDWTGVTNFKVNLTTSSKLQLHIQTHLSLQNATQNKFSLVSGFPLTGIPQFSIAGISLSLGFYEDIDLLFDYDFDSTLEADISTSVVVGYNMFYDSVLGAFQIVSTQNNTNYNGSLHALGHANTSIGLQFTTRLSVLSYTQILVARVTPHLDISATGKYPAFQALPSNHPTPLNHPLFSVNVEICETKHYIEQNAFLNVDYYLGSQFVNNSFIQGRFPSVPVASGCFWSVNSLKNSGVQLTFNTTKTSSFLKSVFAYLLKNDLSRTLQIDIGAMVDIEVNNNQNVKVVFADTESILGSSIVSILIDSVKNKTSTLYGDTIVAKYILEAEPYTPTTSSQVSLSVVNSVYLSTVLFLFVLIVFM